MLIVVVMEEKRATWFDNDADVDDVDDDDNDDDDDDDSGDHQSERICRFRCCVRFEARYAVLVLRQILSFFRSLIKEEKERERE